MFVLFSCDKEDSFTTSGSDKLAFSVDTLRFDTIFTQIGSATRWFRVYNRANQSIRISNISLKGNSQSKFNLNVDGLPGDNHQDVVVYPNDSIYVFAEVTINPDDPVSVSPFFVYDEVIFETNGNTQSVTLEAAGQNANYFPSRWHNDSIAVFSCNGSEVIWDDPKPYVLYGIVGFVDCKLTIPAGARIHVHGGLARDEDGDIYNTGRLVISENASINVQGTVENPVIFEGDRTEDELGFDFKNADGQWTGLIFSRGSKDNVIENAVVKNARFGIFLDSAADLSIKNTQVINTSGPGLFAYHAQVNAENCLFYNNGTNSVQLVYGGDYNFDYCTLANYGGDASALVMTNGVCDDPDNCNVQTARTYRLNALFRNSIIYGSLADEILLDDLTFTRGGNRPMLNYTFSECIIRARDINDPDLGFPDFFDWCDCYNASPSDALFFDINEDDYRLDTLSVAEEQGVPINGIFFDLDGNDRDPQRPDLGCFEYQHN